MPIDPNDALQAMERSLGMVPGAVVVVVLLGGPTILWLLYRFVVQPRTGRYEGGRSDLLWLCTDCRSANEVRDTHCYHCGLSRAAITGPLQVFDGDGLVILEDEDGSDWGDDWQDDPLEEDWSAPPAVPATALGARPTLPPPGPPPVQPARPRRLVAVGPGKARPTEPTSPIPSAPASSDPDLPVSAPVSPSTRKRRHRSPVGAASATRPSSVDPTTDPPAGA